VTETNRFSDELRSAFGLRPRSEWDAALRPVLDDLTRSAELPEMLRDERRRQSLLYQLAARVTVSETHFFRHPDQLEAVIKHLLELDARRPRDARLSLWSAGCASGEEPYSLAILLDRALGERLTRRCRIHANDVSRDALSRAREAAYTAWSFRGTPSWFLEHFQRTADGRLRLGHGQVRGAVEFELAGCLERARGFADQSIDAILFRNVAIYLEPDAIDAIYREFARVLAPDGVLAIGPSDPRPAAAHFAPTEATFVYSRADQAKPARPVERLTEKAVRRERQATLPARPALRVERQRPSPLPPALPARAASAPETTRLLALGDSGRTAHAVELARALVAAEPASPVALRILGQLSIEAGDPAAAREALRQSLYFDPRAALSRYFLAMVLKELGDQKGALAQIEALRRDLATRANDETLDDGETRVSELAEAARFLAGEWR
jgi:chemotaxis protein methyltransferase CheR